MEKEISKETINRSSEEAVSKQIANYYRELINKGEMAPGSSMPSLRELSDKLDVNINSVRSAMEILKKEHLLKISHGEKTIVLKKDDWKKVALILPDTAPCLWNGIAKEISYYFKSAKWELDILEHSGKREVLESCVNSLVKGDYAGALISAPMELMLNARELRDLIYSGYPVVQIGSGLECHTVDNGLYSGAYWGTKHLIEQRYKRIALVGCRSYNADLFVESCKKALAEAELEAFACGYAEDEGFAVEMLKKWLEMENKPDALFYQRSTHAQKCFYFLQSKKIKLGVEMGFMLFDDTQFHRFTVPSPTAVRTHPERTAKRAVDLFMQLISIPKNERLDFKTIGADIVIEEGRTTTDRSRRYLYTPTPGNRYPREDDYYYQFYPRW